MLIISKFHDYYDTAISYGVDKSIVYNRATKDDRDKRRRYRSNLYNEKQEWTVDMFVVGFCGKTYPGVKLTPGSFNSDKKTLFFYSVAKLEAFIEKEGIKTRKRRYGRYYHYSSMNNNEGRKRWFDLSQHIDKKIEDKLTMEKCPVAIWTHDGYIYNPNLKEIGFQVAVDPYTAVQQIQMHISGVLGTNENEIVTISDEDKLHKKGFFEWSFKKLPGSKKRKKNKL